MPGMRTCLLKGQSIKHTLFPPGRSLAMFYFFCSTGTWNIKENNVTIMHVEGKHILRTVIMHTHKKTENKQKFESSCAK